MYKLLVFVVVAFSGCANFRVTAPICDQINPEAGNVPQECRTYDKEKADKAFNKIEEDKRESDKDIIEFHKE
jgi:hypothetical protein